MIELDDVVMEYGGQRALDGLGLSVEEGCVYGLTVQVYPYAVVAAAADRTERCIAATWSAVPLDVEDFEALHAATPAAMPSELNVARTQLGFLIAWAISLVVVAEILAWRRGRRLSSAAQEPIRSTTSTRPAEA